jgi:hypothetical protein
LTALPPRVLEQFLLVEGGAFRARYRFENDTSAKHRYWFILNLAPRDDDVLVLVTPTTSIQRRRDARGSRLANALVDLTPQDHPGLACDCIVDCNSLVPWTKAELRSHIDANAVTPMDPLSREVLARLRHAVSFASVPSTRLKSLVLG